VTAAPVIELREVRKHFGTTEIIRGAELAVAAGERFALIGPNGAGKSTLFNLISGRMEATSGQIMLKGQPVAGLGPQRINHLGLARSFQVTNVFHGLSVYDNLRCAVLWSLRTGYSFWQRLDKLAAVRERAEAAMELTGLAARRHVQAGLLAYADQRALEIGITIAGGADVILLDEPTAGMSRSESDAAVGLIRKVSQGKTLLMVEHDMGVVFGLADRIAVLVYGQVIACGTSEMIRADPGVQEAYLGTKAGAGGGTNG
jgi:branched-chain amino acid transport system ATP-binding protein